jgi:hypothetical protein
MPCARGTCHWPILLSAADADPLRQSAWGRNQALNRAGSSIGRGGLMIAAIASGSRLIARASARPLRRDALVPAPVAYQRKRSRCPVDRLRLARALRSARNQRRTRARIVRQAADPPSIDLADSWGFDIKKIRKVPKVPERFQRKVLGFQRIMNLWNLWNLFHTLTHTHARAYGAIAKKGSKRSKGSHPVDSAAFLPGTFLEPLEPSGMTRTEPGNPSLCQPQSLRREILRYL